MNKYTKAALLSATLLIPILIFLFLKFFGENKFDIPIYYEQGTPEYFRACNGENSGQHRVDVDNIDLPATVLFLNQTETFTFTDVQNVTERLQDALQGVNYKIYARDSISETDYLDSAQFIQQMRCNFVTDTVNQFILIDSEKRIRGYYYTDRDDIDRLMVELKILLENERAN